MKMMWKLDAPASTQIMSSIRNNKWVKRKAKRSRFNIGMNPIVLVSLIAAIAVVIWVIAFNFFRINFK
jgi:hypothetical protein